MEDTSLNLNRIIAWAWTLLCVYIAATVAGQITANGLLSLEPLLGARVWFQWMFQLIGFRRVSVAMLVGFVLVGVVYYFLEKMIRYFLLVAGSDEPEIDPVRSQSLTYALGILLAVFDAVLLYIGLSRPSGWDSPQDNFAAAVFTGLYLSLMAGSAYISTILWLRSERT